MREEQSENKMDKIAAHRYHVVKFLENPFKDSERVSCELACVPKSWCEWSSREENIVRVWYPTEDKCNTEIRVRKREKKSDQWVSVLAVLKYSKDLYEEAKIYIQNKKCSENKNNEDRTSLSAQVAERTCKTTSSLNRNEATVENKRDDKGWGISKKTENSMMIKIFKKKATTDCDKTPHNKRSKLNEPGESVDEVAVPSQAFMIQTLTHKASNEDLCRQDTPAVKVNDRNSTEKEQKVNQNVPKTNPSLDPKSLPILVECCEMILELQKCLSVLPKEIVNKRIKTDNGRSAITNDAIASTSRDTTAQPPKLNEKKRIKEQTDENDFDDDRCSDDDNCENNDSNTKQKCPRRLKTFVLPPEYDANDSRWTLKHREFVPGLIELLENTGVYVSDTGFEKADRLGKNNHDFGRRLLSEVFTASALRTCSWTGARSPRDSHGTNVRPGLDAHAREVLLDYVMESSIIKSSDKLKDVRKGLITALRSYMSTKRPKRYYIHV